MYYMIYLSRIVCCVSNKKTNLTLPVFKEHSHSFTELTVARFCHQEVNSSGERRLLHQAKEKVGAEGPV